MNFQIELMKTALADLGLSEITGPKDHPKIELAHKLTRVEGLKDRDYTDEIPWCASMMSLWVLMTSAKINPGRVFNWLVLRKTPSDQVEKFFQYTFGEYWETFVNQKDNGIMVPEPTWSGAALDFRNWGDPVPKGQYQIGDICVFTRGGVGKGHVALFLRGGWVFMTVLGGNQSNKVCESDTYFKSKLITVRRYPM